MRSITAVPALLSLVSSTLLLGPPIAKAQIVDGAVERMDAYLSDNVERGVSATILVAHGDDVLLSRGYGLANREEGVPNTTETVFDIGSLTKQFTAAAILLLEDRGALHLSDDLAIHFENVPADKAAITIHQLLIHSAGLAEYPASDFDPVTRAQYLAHAFDAPLAFEPGMRFSYSNVGYGLLSMIIERTADMPYELFLRRAFFDPLGMEQTGYLAPDWELGKIAHGYAADFYDQGTSIERYLEAGVSPVLLGNGGIHSTIGDMHRWIRAVTSHEVLTEASVDRLFDPHIPLPESDREYGSGFGYGYGWLVGRSLHGTPYITHSGNNGSFRSTVILTPVDGITVIYLSNNGHEDSFEIPFAIERMTVERAYEPEPLIPSSYRVVDDYVESRPITAVGGLPNQYEEMRGHPLDDRSLLNRLGLLYLGEGRHMEWAVELLKLNVELFPDDGNLWDSLGEGYVAAGQPESAIRSFQRALELGPAENCQWCANARSRLEQLGGTP